MSSSNGSTPTVTRDADRMYVATVDFTARYHGETIHLRAGVDRCGGDCDLVRDYPQNFEPAD